MSKEYNSLLLTKFLSATDEKDIIYFLEKIGEIGDPIFLYPVYEAYKNNKISHISHYYISIISKLESEDVSRIAMEIGDNKDIQMNDMVYVLEIFDKFKIYNKHAMEISLRALGMYVKNDDSDEYELYSIISYFKSANALKDIQNVLMKIFFSEKFNTKSKEYALGKWIEADTKNNLQFIIDSIKNKQTNKNEEVLIARVVSTWNGPLANELKLIIKTSENNEARYIIENVEENKAQLKLKEKKNIENKERIDKVYGNAALIEKIIILREKINDMSMRNTDIKFPIFPQNEAIVLQLKVANDDATLIKSCVNLREIIQNLNNDLGGHGLDIVDIRKLLTSSEESDFNKSINKLYIYLHSRKINIDESVYGLKALNQITGLIGAHSKSEKPKLLKKLKIAQLDKDYNEEAYDVVHKRLLEMYLDSLNLLLNALSSIDDL